MREETPIETLRRIIEYGDSAFGQMDSFEAFDNELMNGAVKDDDRDLFDADYDQFHSLDDERVVVLLFIIAIVKENFDLSFFKDLYTKSYKKQDIDCCAIELGDIVIAFKRLVDNFDGILKIGGVTSRENMKFTKEVLKEYDENLGSITVYMEGYSPSFSFDVCFGDIKEFFEAYSPDNFRRAITYYDGHEWNHNSTPKDISELARLIFEQGEGDFVLDLCSGRGSFLFNYINNDTNNKNRYLGIELNKKMAFLTSVLLKMTDTNSEIKNIDMFSFQPKTSYDKIFCEPPFGINISSQTKKNIANKSIFDCPVSTSPEWFFVSYGLTHLSDTGRMVAIVPNGILSNVRDRIFRKQLIDGGYVEAIVQLPNDILNGVRVFTSIIVLSHGNKTVKFIDGCRCSDKNSKNQKYCSKNSTLNVKKVFEKLTQKEDSEISKNIGLEVLEKKDYILTTGSFIGNLASLQKLPNEKKLGSIAKTIYRGVQFLKNERDEYTPELGEKHIAKLVTASNIEYGKIRGSFTKIKDNPERFSKFYLEDGDIIVSARGASVKAGVVEIKNDELLVPGDGIIVVRLKDPEDAFYICLFLQSGVGQILLSEIQTGTVLKLLNASSLSKLRVPFPSKILHKKMLGTQFRDDMDMLYSLQKQAKQIEQDTKNRLNGICGISGEISLMNNER